MPESGSHPTPLHRALDWTEREAEAIGLDLKALAGSRPLAIVTPELESALAAVLPAALPAGEASVADLLSSIHWATIRTGLGAFGAAFVQGVLSRIATSAAMTNPNPGQTSAAKS